MGVVVGGHKCLWDGTQLQVEMAAGATGNKKIPPKTVLAFTKGGKICSSGTGGIPWTFESGKDLVVDSAKLEAPEAEIGPAIAEALASFMDRVGATSIIKHSWTLPEIKGTKKLKASGVIKFHADTDAWRAVLESTKSMGQCNACWLVNHKKQENRVLPVGVALLLKKQVVITPNAPLVLQ